MPEAHCIESLAFEVDFPSEDDALDGQSRAARFARLQAPRIIEEVFDAHSRRGQVWRYDTLEIDLGPVAGDDLEPQWEARLRERLAEVLQAHQAEAAGLAQPGPGLSAQDDGNGGESRPTQTSSPEVRLETLLHFLRHGRLPWHAEQGLSMPLEPLVRQVLAERGAALAAAWRASPDRQAMVRRAARQWSPAVLVALARVLAESPGSGASAAWGREVEDWVDGLARWWRQSAPSPTEAPRHLLWQGLLDALLGETAAADRREDPGPQPPSDTEEQARLLARLQAWFDPQDPADGSLAPWQALLHAERSWARQTLLRLGRGVRARRRMARALPSPMLNALMALWLAPAEQALLQAALPVDDLWGPADAAPDLAQRWEETLAHLLLHPAPALFDTADHLDGVLRRRSEREHQPVSVLLGPLDSAWRSGASHRPAQGAPQALLRAWLQRHRPGPANPAAQGASRRAELEAALARGTLDGVESAWSEALEDDAPWLLDLLRRVGRRRSVQRRIARDWQAAARTQLLQLWLPEPGLSTVLAALHAPAREGLPGTGEAPPAPALWEDLLAHLWQITPGTFFNAEAYVRGLRERMAAGKVGGDADIAFSRAQAHAPDAAAIAAAAVMEEAATSRPPKTSAEAEASAGAPAIESPDLHRTAPHTAFPGGRTLSPSSAQRARLEAALAEGSLRGVESAWSHALRHQPGWLRDRLREAGRVPAVRRRMAQAWDEGALTQAAALWLPAEAHRALVADIVHGPDCAALADTGHGRPRRLWESVLEHLFLEVSARFDPEDCLRSVLRQDAEVLGVGVPVLAMAAARRFASTPVPSGPAGAVLQRVVGAWARATALPAALRQRDPPFTPRASSEATAPPGGPPVPEDGPAPTARREAGGPQASPAPLAGASVRPAHGNPGGVATGSPSPSSASGVGSTAAAEPAAAAQARPASSRTDDAHPATRALLQPSPPSADEIADFHHRLAQALAAPTPAVRDAWLTALESPRATARLLEWLPPPDWAPVLAWLRPTEHLAVRQGAALMESACRGIGTPLSPGTYARLHAQFILRELFEEGRSFDPVASGVRLAQHLAEALTPPQPRHWLVTLAAELTRHAAPAAWPSAQVSDPQATAIAQALTASLPPTGTAAVAAHTAPASAGPTGDAIAPGESLYVANAGLVLAGAYLQRLLGMLDLAGNEAFHTPQAAERAVHLLQFLVTGELDTPEPHLVLNKLLCGLPLDTPVIRGIEASAQERATATGLLQAMIAHWKIIGQTSVAGLRESFLQREGRLHCDEDGWHLQVEPRSFDMLLDQLPWGYSLLKFQWMERPLHVEWR